MNRRKFIANIITTAAGAMVANSNTLLATGTAY